jgi:hypothetical protein
MMPMSNGFFDFVGSSIAISLSFDECPRVYSRPAVRADAAAALAGIQDFFSPRKCGSPKIITLTESSGNS